MNFAATSQLRNILIIWLLAAVTDIVLFVSLAHTTKVSAPTIQWQADTAFKTVSIVETRSRHHLWWR